MFPIILKGSTNFVARDSLMFCYCGLCEKQLSWAPSGVATFKASHCGLVYEAEPEDMDLRRYVVMGCKPEYDNVTPLFKKKPERMTFA